MNSERTPEITRRSMLVSFGGIATGLAARQAMATDKESIESEPRRKTMSQIQKEYERLLPLWQEERKAYRFSSNTRDYWTGPHGKAIIALGPAIIPFIIQQLKAGDFFFNVPMDVIIGVEIADKTTMSEQARSKLWIEWWEAARKSPT